jgi:hypothetical protein
LFRYGVLLAHNKSGGWVTNLAELSDELAHLTAWRIDQSTAGELWPSQKNDVWIFD